MKRPTPSGPVFLLLALVVPVSVTASARSASASAADSTGHPRRVSRAVAAQLQELRHAAPRLDPEVLLLALSAADCASRTGAAPGARYLTVIDYSLPSTRRRLWLFDLAQRRLLSRELVAHGVNTGSNRATRFSNVEGSRQSSIGLFRTGETYYGRNGYSLRLDGLEQGVNELARARAIVMHGADYVNDEFARRHGRLGRSWGCPALDEAVTRRVIDRIQGGHLLFSYYPDEKWLASSRFLRCTASEPVQQTLAAAQ